MVQILVISSYKNKYEHRTTNRGNRPQETKNPESRTSLEYDSMNPWRSNDPRVSVRLRSMIIKETEHFIERVDERYEKPTIFATSTFEWLMKKLQKKDNMRGKITSYKWRIIEHKWKMIETKWLCYRDRVETLKFCYSWEFPKYTLITFFKTDRKIFDK